MDLLGLPTAICADKLRFCGVEDDLSLGESAKFLLLIASFQIAANFSKRFGYFCVDVGGG